jgi:hypothetical protein
MIERVARRATEVGRVGPGGAWADEWRIGGCRRPDAASLTEKVVRAAASPRVGWAPAGPSACRTHRRRLRLLPVTRTRSFDRLAGTWPWRRVRACTPRGLDPRVDRGTGRARPWSQSFCSPRVITWAFLRTPACHPQTGSPCCYVAPAVRRGTLASRRVSAFPPPSRSGLVDPARLKL